MNTENVERLEAAFASGRLVRPSAEEPNFTDLARALLRLAGADGIESAGAVEHFERLAGKAEHYVLLLIDGLGLTLLEKAPPDGFLRRHLAAEFNSVCPSTTASALTTLATAEWPAVHALTGWWVYLPAKGISTVPLPFVECFTDRPLAEAGITPEELFVVPSAWPRMKHAPVTVICDGIAESVYTRYSAGGTPRRGYVRLDEAFAAARERPASATGPTFTYVYLPQLDSLCHDEGTAAEGVAPLLSAFDSLAEALRRDLPNDARLIITADHGMTDVPPEGRHVLAHDDPLLAELLCPPTGEPRMPVLHAKEGRAQAARGLFDERYAAQFALLTPDEAEALQLFGPGRLSSAARPRLGDFVGFALEPASISFRPAGADADALPAVHAGLSPAEMRIPLILA